MKQRFYYAFQYDDGVNTTTGTPNRGKGRWHGRYSTAGVSYAFTSRKERNAFVAQGCPSYGGRIACGRRYLNYLNRGLEKDFRAILFESIERTAIEERETQE
jgi:hypothetical protein